MDDRFELYDLKVEVVEGDRPFVCSHHVGDFFLVEGENLVFPENNSFSMYAGCTIGMTQSDGSEGYGNTSTQKTDVI